MITKQVNSIPVISTILLALLFAVGAHAGQPALWETSGRVELLKGEARGVSISDTGVVMLAPKLNEVFNTQQTYVWSSAVDGQGIELQGSWKGKGREYQAKYSGNFVRRSAHLKGTQSWTDGGKTVTRNCTGAIKRPLKAFLPRKPKPSAAQ